MSKFRHLVSSYVMLPVTPPPINPPQSSFLFSTRVSGKWWNLLLFWLFFKLLPDSTKVAGFIPRLGLFSCLDSLSVSDGGWIQTTNLFDFASLTSRKQWCPGLIINQKPVRRNVLRHVSDDVLMMMMMMILTMLMTTMLWFLIHLFSDLAQNVVWFRSTSIEANRNPEGDKALSTITTPTTHTHTLMASSLSRAAGYWCERKHPKEVIRIYKKSEVSVSHDFLKILKAII